MRILVVIPHYFGPSHPENNLPAISSYIEPLGRIAALSEVIVGLHRHFGPNRHVCDGTPIEADASAPERKVDVVILVNRGHELTGELGLDAGTIETCYVDCKPPWIAFEAQRVFRERLGQYDFYCFMEDDLIIHDPAFFDKLIWFQKNFGYTSLLMPVRCEVPATGTPAKVIVDFDLEEWGYRPFRRPGQRDEIEGVWNGQRQLFYLPKNPHAGSFFLTGEQMDYWTKQPTYDDRDASWMGPIESAGTFSVGRVFDVYKPLRPDPFFLEVHHFGVRYASRMPPEGRRYGDPPLLAIAQNAIRAALDPKISEIEGDGNRTAGPSFPRLFRHWIAQGSAVELRGQLDTLELQVRRQAHELDVRNVADNEALRQRAALIEHNQQLKNVNERFERHNEDLRRHAEGLAQHNAELRQHAGGLEQHNEDLQRHAEGFEQHNEDLRRHAEGLERQAEGLKQQVEGLKQHAEELNQHAEGLKQYSDQLAGRITTLNREIEQERYMRSHSLRWLLGSLRAELLRRWRGRAAV